MKTDLLWKGFLLGCLLLAALAGCAMVAPETATPRPSATPVPPAGTPGPTSCAEVEGNCLELSFDGESCMYNGPTDLVAGPVTLLFFNESGERAAVNLVRHTGNETIQDMIDLIGEEPGTGHAPPWVRNVNPWQVIRSGEIYTWQGDLEPGIHTMVCASPARGVWFGTGLTVED